MQIKALDEDDIRWSGASVCMLGGIVTFKAVVDDRVLPAAEADNSQLVHVPCFHRLFVSKASGSVHCADESSLQGGRDIKP